MVPVPELKNPPGASDTMLPPAEVCGQVKETVAEYLFGVLMLV
jgi:hypothetical protein